MGRTKMRICCVELSHEKVCRWGPTLTFLSFVRTGVSQMPVSETGNRKHGQIPERYGKRRVTMNLTSLGTKFLHSIVYTPRSWILISAEAKNVLRFSSTFSVNLSPQATLRTLLWSVAGNDVGSVLCLTSASLLFPMHSFYQEEEELNSQIRTPNSILCFSHPVKVIHLPTKALSCNH